MTYVKIGNLGAIGVVIDQPAHELPVNAFTRAVNFRFRDGCAERIEGEVKIFAAPLVTPYFITSYQNATSRCFIHAGVGRVFSDAGDTRTEITPATAFTGTQDDRWTGGTLNGVLVLNNGVEQPVYWGGNVADDLATLPGWDSTWRAKCVRPFKNYLVALDITKSSTRLPHMVKWSASAVPGAIPASWDAANAALDAGEVDLAEEPSLMVDQLPMGDVNVIYKERAMFSMTYGGHPYIWSFRRLPGDVGALARGCVASIPQGHVVLTSGDVILHAGQGPQSIISGRLRRWLFSNIDTTTYKRSFVVANPPRNEVWVCVPLAGDAVPSLALVWNYQADTWSTRELSAATYGTVGQLTDGKAETWDSNTDVWSDDTVMWNASKLSASESRLLTTSTAPRINVTEGHSRFNGSTYTSILERTGLALDAPAVVKTVRAMFPRIDGPAGAKIQIEFGAAMKAEEAPIYSEPVTYTIGTTFKVDSFATGRFLAFRFSSTDNQLWRIKSYDIELSARGKF